MFVAAADFEYDSDAPELTAAATNFGTNDPTPKDASAVERCSCSQNSVRCWCRYEAYTRCTKPNNGECDKFGSHMYEIESCTRCKIAAKAHHRCECTGATQPLRTGNWESMVALRARSHQPGTLKFACVRGLGEAMTGNVCRSQNPIIFLRD